jgi:hypothetical protein
MKQVGRRSEGYRHEGEKKCGDALAAEAGDKPKEERKSGAEYQAGDDWKIEGSVFAAMDDVAGKSSQTEGELAAEVQQRAAEEEERAENEKQTAELARGIHEESVEEKRGKEARR